jgi:hypothetical protein
MSNDLAAEITGRVRKSLDGLLATRAWRRLPALLPLGQRLFTRYSDWVDGLFSRLHLPLTSALLLGRSSNLQLSPLSYAWFDRRWIDRRKRSRSFWRKSGSEKDDAIQGLSVPEYFFEEDADEGLIKQFQSEPADHIILNLPTLTTLSAGNTEFPRAEQLAKKIALRLELLTNRGFHTPWRTPFEATGVPYYPGMAANDSLLDKGREIITDQRSSHLEETFYPLGPLDLSPPGLHPFSEQYVGTALMSVPGKLSLAERTPTQGVPPLVSSSEGMNFSFEPSGALPAAPSNEPESEANIASLSYLSGFPFMTSNNVPAGKALASSLSHLSESPSMTLNNILVRKVFSRLQSLFGTRLVASGTNLTGEALADSPSYLSEPPQVASDAISAGKELAASPSHLFEPPQAISDAVLAGKAGATDVSLPEEPPLFRRDEIPDMASVAYRYFGSLVPQLPLDKTLGSRQASPLHWSAGHIPPSLTGDAIGQEMGGPAKAVAPTIKNSSLGGYNRSTKVGLALAPISRQRENIPTATSNAVSTGQEGASDSVDETTAALDPEALASEVYSILKRRLIVERERTTSIVA